MNDNIKLLFSCLIFLFLSSACNLKGGELNDTPPDGFKTGDLIFQESVSAQCVAVKKATGSKYSHMGIIFNNTDGLYVLEAVQPVKLTPLREWIARGVDNHYVVKRLRDHEILEDEIIHKMMQSGMQYLGRDYDIYFGWSDERIYCSELAWKIYKDGAGIEIGELRKLGDFDLSSPEVKKIMAQRYGANIPLNEPVISPADMFDSDLLITVFEN